jgi:hypothetical protein
VTTRAAAGEPAFAQRPRAENTTRDEQEGSLLVAVGRAS